MRRLAVLLCLASCVSMRAASTEKVDATPERIVRGEALATGWAGCIHCHSTPDQDAFGTPPLPGTEGTGGTCWDERIGFPGAVCSTNLTADPEVGLGAWTDGEILRAMREGVSRDGRALFPLMPYPSYRRMSDDDAKAIVAYLRTLPAKKSEVPKPHLNFPVSLFIKSVPEPLEGPVAAPDHSDTVAWGRYLAAPCQHCHTPVNGRGREIEGKEFSGGQEFKFLWGGSAVSANLTSDPTGLGNLSRAAFVSTFKGYADSEVHRIKVKREKNTIMPWASYGRMSEDELGALYDYLRTVPKVANEVNTHPPE